VFPGADDLLPRLNGGQALDLWAANARALREAGVQQIEISGLCTACHSGDFFSHRADGALTGRFGALLALR
jgi:copper oxidase (laccase) domain-containing protein